MAHRLGHPELPDRWPLSALKVVDSVDFPGDVSQPEPVGPKTRGQRLLWHRPSYPSSGSPAPTSTAPRHVLFCMNTHITPLRPSARPSEAPAPPGSRPWGPPRQRENLGRPCPTLPVTTTPAPALAIKATTLRGPHRRTGQRACCSDGLSVLGAEMNGGSRCRLQRAGGRGDVTANSQGQGLRPGAGDRQTPEVGPSSREVTKGGKTPENVPGGEQRARGSEAAGWRGRRGQSLGASSRAPQTTTAPWKGRATRADRAPALDERTLSR